MRAVGETRRRLEALGLRLPAAPRPMGAYVPLISAGPLAFLSGMGPLREGAPAFVGVLGETLTLEEGRQAAALAALNALATLEAEMGDLDRVSGIVRVCVNLRTAPGFLALPAVADGASEILAAVFPSGHVRQVLGVNMLAAGMCVVLDVIASVEKFGHRTSAETFT